MQPSHIARDKHVVRRTPGSPDPSAWFNVRAIVALTWAIMNGRASERAAKKMMQVSLAVDGACAFVSL